MFSTENDTVPQISTVSEMAVCFEWSNTVSNERVVLAFNLHAFPVT